MIPKQSIEIFGRAKAMAERYRRMDVQLLDMIDEVDRRKVVLHYGCSSLFKFCVELLDLTPAVTMNLINVMRKCREVPELRAAITAGLHLTKARRLVPVITRENHAYWIKLARELSKHALERELAKVNPQFVEHETVRPTAPDRNQITFFTSDARLDALMRAQDVVSNSFQKSINVDATFAHLVEYFLSKEDPVVKADRNVRRINASIRTKVFARDRGRCQMILAGGARCEQTRFIDLHHKYARFRGGIDHIDNLTTLCSGCHRAWHLKHGDVPLFKSVDKDLSDASAPGQTESG